MNTFDNTNNSVEHLRNRWRMFMAVKLFITDTIFNRKYEGKKSQIKSNLNLVDTCARLMIYLSCMKEEITPFVRMAGIPKCLRRICAFWN